MRRTPFVEPASGLKKRIGGVSGLFWVLRGGTRRAFLPKHPHARVAMHSLATVTGVAIAGTTWTGSPLLAFATYAGGFVGFHLVLVPFCSLWLVLTGGLNRWVKGIVEEELIRYDLATYGRQLERILPNGAAARKEVERD